MMHIQTLRVHGLCQISYYVDAQYACYKSTKCGMYLTAREAYASAGNLVLKDTWNDSPT